MAEDIKKGHYEYTPRIIVDETGKLKQIYIPADAISSEAKPGYNAGNPLLDEINEQLRKQGLIDKLKELYKKQNIDEQLRKKGLMEEYKQLRKEGLIEDLDDIIHIQK